MCKKSKVDAFVEDLEHRVDRMLAMVFAIIPRKDGNLWDLSKVEDIKHIARNIKEKAAPFNWNTEISESNHTQHGKAGAATTQKRREEIYLPQVGRQLDVHHLIDHIRRNADIQAMNPISSLRLQEESWYVQSNHTGPKQKTPAWILLATGEFEFRHAGANLTSPLVRNYILEMLKSSNDLHQEETEEWENNGRQGDPPLGPILEIRGYSEASIEGLPFRADPLYQNDKPWYDWCKAVYTDENDKPQVAVAKMLVFLSWTSDPNIGEDRKISHGILIHWCDSRNDTDRSLDTLLQTSWRLFYQLDPAVSRTATKPFIQLIEYQNVQAQAFVVEETPGIQESEPEYRRVIEIAPRSEWASIFLTEDWFMWIRSLYQKKKQKENKDKFIGYNGRRWEMIDGIRDYSYNYRCANPILGTAEAGGELDSDNNEESGNGELEDSEEVHEAKDSDSDEGEMTNALLALSKRQKT